MYMIIAPVSEKLVADIQHYREKYDPLAKIIPPHIGIVKPFLFSEPIQELYNHLDEVGELHSPIKVSTAGWDVYNWIVADQTNYQFRLPLMAGRQEFVFLRRTLIDAPLAHLARQDEDYWPHVVFGRFSNDTDADTAKKELKEFKSQFIFRVTHFELVHRDEPVQPWQTLKQIGLKATVAGKRRQPTAEIKT